MSTEKQIDANRANAQQSTGPKTDAGKAASSQNAAKHSLTSKYLIILPGMEPAFAELDSGLRGKLDPQGALQEVIYKRVVECAWNLERCRKAEGDVLTKVAHSNVDPLVNAEFQDRFDRIHRYARESENSMYKAMRELGKLQTEQQFRDEAFQLTQEQADDPEFMAKSPHAIGATCSLAQVLKNLSAYRKSTPRQHPRFSPDHDRLDLEHFDRIKAKSAQPPTVQTNATAA